MPNPLLDLPPDLRDSQVLYHVRFTCPYDGHKFIHSMLMSCVRKDTTMLEHFLMRSKDGKIVSYNIVGGIGTDTYTQGVAEAKASQVAQQGYVPLPPGMEAVVETDIAQASRAKEDLLRSMGLLSDKHQSADQIREDVHPEFAKQE